MTPPQGVSGILKVGPDRSVVPRRPISAKAPVSCVAPVWWSSGPASSLSLLSQLKRGPRGGPPRAPRCPAAARRAPCRQSTPEQRGGRLPAPVPACSRAGSSGDPRGGAVRRAPILGPQGPLVRATLPGPLARHRELTFRHGQVGHRLQRYLAEVRASLARLTTEGSGRHLAATRRTEATVRGKFCPAASAPCMLRQSHAAG